MCNNMKYFKILVILTLSLSTSSCKKYLDVKKSSGQILIETANDCQLLLNDYKSMNVGYPSDGESSSDDYYLTDANLLAMNTEDAEVLTWKSGSIRSVANPQWQFPYKVVYLSNLVLETLDKIKEQTEPLLFKDLRGQALFFRAFSFWQVAQLYSKPYTAATAAGSPGIPLRLSSDINGVSLRGSLEETYLRILNDLREAKDILSSSQVVASRPNKAAALAMLSRVCLSMENYNDALTYATEALELNKQLMDFNSLSTSSATPIARFNIEVIFHSVMTPAAMLVPGSAPNNIAKITDDLYASYNSNDLRKVVFFKENTQSVQLRNAAGGLVTVTIPNGTYRFSGNYESVTNAALFNGLAVDELYLTRAECYARNGNPNAAMADLNALLITRWKSGTYNPRTAINASDALSQILIERRKELVMRGLRWVDGRRLKVGFTRQIKSINYSGTTTAPIRDLSISNSYALSANDLRFTLLIPNDVIQTSSIEQNLR